MTTEHTSIIHRMHQVLEKYREGEDIEIQIPGNEATFDFDEAEQKAAQQLRSKERQERRANLGLHQHQNTVAFFHKRRQENSASSQTKREMDVVTDMTEIDDLDRGKTWKQLDNFMKRKRLREFVEWYQTQHDDADADMVQILLQNFREGKYRKTNELTYDSNLGRITAIPDYN